MTNQELDRICCEFAGIEPLKSGAHDKRIWFHCSRKKAENQGLAWDYEYPRVSTDWAAAGRLMDALRIKHVWISIQSGTGWSVKVGVSPSMSAEAAELSLPMALALAVAQLVASHESRNP